MRRFRPLGRELDRRQRVLDLVRDAAGDVAPSGGALRGDKLGDVVERDDEAVLSELGGLFSRHANREGAPRVHCRVISVTCPWVRR